LARGGAVLASARKSRVPLTVRSGFTERAPIRVICAQCGTPTEALPWADRYQHETRRLQQHLGLQAASMPIVRVAASRSCDALSSAPGTRCERSGVASGGSSSLGASFDGTAGRTVGLHVQLAAAYQIEEAFSPLPPAFRSSRNDRPSAGRSNDGSSLCNVLSGNACRNGHSLPLSNGA